LPKQLTIYVLGQLTAILCAEAMEQAPPSSSGYIPVPLSNEGIVVRDGLVQLDFSI